MTLIKGFELPVIRPFLDETRIAWRVVVDPPLEEGGSRMAKVEGTYEQYTYSGTAEIRKATTEEVKVVAHLKAGITHLIINALEEDAMDDLIEWGEMEVHEDPKVPTQFVASIRGALKENLRVAFVGSCHTMTGEPKPDTPLWNKVKAEMRRRIWTQFKQAGYV
jgi:hypothetical protein